eukprot:1542338-Heterocapsa_arctica.AAC.1
MECEVCSVAFGSFSAHATHMVRYHGMYSMIAKLVLTNKCPWCHSTFVSRQGAVQHAEVAYRRGICCLDNSIWPHILQEIEEMECP